MKSLLLFLFLLTFVAANVAAQVHSRVINGYEFGGKTTWAVSLSAQNSKTPYDGHFCGGALIADQWVITAAHCVDEIRSSPNSLRVSGGVADLTSPALQSIEVDGIIVHEKYEPVTSRNDVALVHLSRAFVNVPPIPLISTPVAGGEGNVYGWGLTDPLANGGDRSSVPRVLRAARLPVQSDEVCREVMGNIFLAPNNICAGVLSSSNTLIDGVDSCQGDSGGPLTIFENGVEKLAGIVSWGQECASATYYGVYTEVPAFRSWLTQPRILPPFSREAPQIWGKSSVGSTLQCKTGSLGGGQVEKIKYQWREASSGKIVGRAKRLKVRPALAGKSVLCEPTFFNAGGSTRAQSQATRKILSGRPQRRFRIEAPVPVEAEILCDKDVCDLMLQTAVAVENIWAVLAPRQKVPAKRSTFNNWQIEISRTQFSKIENGLHIQVQVYSPVISAVTLQ